jgi:VanZ family protein
MSLIFFYRLPVITLCAFIFWQSSFPGIISQPLFPYDDKVMHFGVYALLALLVARAVQKENPMWSPGKIKIIAILFVSVFGLSDELHQAFVPARFASVLDFLADCAGAVAGCLFYINFVLKKNTRGRNQCRRQ